MKTLLTFILVVVIITTAHGFVLPDVIDNCEKVCVLQQYEDFTLYGINFNGEPALARYDKAGNLFSYVYTTEESGELVINGYALINGKWTRIGLGFTGELLVCQFLNVVAQYIK